MLKLAFIAYHLDDRNIIGSARARYLLGLLRKKQELDITVVSRLSEGTLAAGCRLFWLLKLAFKLTRKYDRIYVSCDPFWHLPVILAMSAIFGGRLMVNFRDPWSLNISRARGYRCPAVTRRWVEFLEKIIYRRAEIFEVCVPEVRAGYRRLFGDDRKIMVVLNGHELNNELLQRLEPLRPKSVSSSISAVCIGKFASYNPNALATLKRMIGEAEGHGLEMKFIFIDPDRETIKSLEKDEAVFSKCTILKRQSYEETMKIAASANLALCQVRDENIDHSTKIYDYVGLGLPVYDNFDHNKPFYKFFKPYIATTINDIKPKEMDWEGRFSRRAQFAPLVEILLTRPVKTQ